MSEEREVGLLAWWRAMEGRHEDRAWRELNALECFARKQAYHAAGELEGRT